MMMTDEYTKRSLERFRDSLRDIMRADPNWNPSCSLCRGPVLDEYQMWRRCVTCDLYFCENCISAHFKQEHPKV